MATTAEKVAEMLDNNGQRLKAADGRTLDDLCRAAGARVESGADAGRGGMLRYGFRDGSAIVDCCGAAWDLAHPYCVCGFCWAGADPRCTEQS